MNRDSEDIQRRILMLLQDLLPTASLPDVEAASRALGCEATGQFALEQPNLLTPRPMNSSTSDFSESNRSFQKEPSLELGDVPVVQERFHALLKTHLRGQIEKNPPVFPWETEVLDYGTEAEPVVEPGVWGWLRQVRDIKLPVPAHIPESVLAILLERCQEVVQSSLQDGKKLVRAVEDLFPGQDEALNYLAVNLMMSPSRSPSAAPVEPMISSYEAAAPAQQMLLSLLAAKEIVSSLTLKVTAQEPVADRRWETDAGVVTLQVTYQPQASIRVQTTLPCGGTLILRNGQQTMTQRATPGCLSAELFEPKPGHTYGLEVALQGLETPLSFAIRLD
uniref:PatU n=1 Tax=Oscillatoriales cyanobacterium SpSt-402 TaxID=2282168 RepID=A0A832GZL0_9CYAN